MNYEVGDTVRIKAWVDMEKVPGAISAGGNIQIPNSPQFTSIMRRYCYKELIIRQTLPLHDRTRYYMYDPDNNQTINWCFGEHTFILVKKAIKLKMPSNKFKEELL